MPVVKRQQGRNVEIRNAIAVSKHEGLVICEPAPQALEPPARLGVEPRVDQMDMPIDLTAVVNGGLAACQIDREVIIQRVIVEEIPFDDFSLVPQGNNKFLEALRGVNVHNVPQDGFLANFDHRLGTQDRLFAQT